jgi:hypothetical protein
MVPPTSRSGSWRAVGGPCGLCVGQDDEEEEARRGGGTGRGPLGRLVRRWVLAVSQGRVAAVLGRRSVRGGGLGRWCPRGGQFPGEPPRGALRRGWGFWIELVALARETREGDEGG